MTDRLRAAQWAANVLSKAPLILDTETTGLEEGEIIQIAIIDHTGAALLDTFVRPVHPIPRGAFEVHGITDAMVADAPRWPLVAGSVLGLIYDHDLIIYNATYDRRMMHQSGELNGMAKINWKELATFHDAMEYYAAFYGDWNQYHRSYRWQRLTAACEQQGIPEPVAPAHSALGDCLRTLALLQVMAKAAENES